MKSMVKMDCRGCVDPIPGVKICFSSPTCFSYPIGSMYGIYANIWGVLMVNVTIYSIHGFYGILETQTLIITVGFNPQGVPLSCCSWPLIAAAVRANEEIPTWQSGTGDMSISWVKKGQLLTTSCVFRCLFVDVFCRLWVV